ncbi:unnamed protein product [Pieris macdunnoughi]|uniref:Solute carrier family 3 member 2 N-terminal domain-containing protein n=1 Tax=Pieris macdunnoughi TaxID=345717 RepID=A0A821T688_9NEOP|nr:unnamed protein product [Pieris macdunnoughi]
MDPERQPLLQQARRVRPLSYEEVLRTSTQLPWRSARFLIILLFWATMAMFLSIIVCILLTSACSISGNGPSVPPVHLTFAPLISRTMH